MNPNSTQPQGPQNPGVSAGPESASVINNDVQNQANNGQSLDQPQQPNTQSETNQVSVTQPEVQDVSREEDQVPEQDQAALDRLLQNYVGGEEESATTQEIKDTKHKLMANRPEQNNGQNAVSGVGSTTQEASDSPRNYVVGEGSAQTQQPEQPSPSQTEAASPAMKREPTQEQQDVGDLLGPMEENAKTSTAESDLGANLGNVASDSDSGNASPQEYTPKEVDLNVDTAPTLTNESSNPVTTSPEETKDMQPKEPSEIERTEKLEDNLASIPGLELGSSTTKSEPEQPTGLEIDDEDEEDVAPQPKTADPEIKLDLPLLEDDLDEAESVITEKKQASELEESRVEKEDTRESLATKTDLDIGEAAVDSHIDAAPEVNPVKNEEEEEEEEEDEDQDLPEQPSLEEEEEMDENDLPRVSNFETSSKSMELPDLSHYEDEEGAKSAKLTIEPIKETDVGSEDERQKVAELLESGNWERLAEEVQRINAKRHLIEIGQGVAAGLKEGLEDWEEVNDKRRDAYKEYYIQMKVQEGMEEDHFDEDQARKFAEHAWEIHYDDLEHDHRTKRHEAEDKLHPDMEIDEKGVVKSKSTPVTPEVNPVKNEEEEEEEEEDEDQDLPEQPSLEEEEEEEEMDEDDLPEASTNPKELAGDNGLFGWLARTETLKALGSDTKKHVANTAINLYKARGSEDKPESGSINTDEIKRFDQKAQQAINKNPELASKIIQEAEKGLEAVING